MKFLLIFFILFSPMDDVEKEILNEYRFHNLDNILVLSKNILYSGEDKGKITINKRLYKYRVNVLAEPRQYTYGDDVKPIIPEYTVELISKSRSYRIHIKGEKIFIISDNLSFMCEYKNNEVTLKTKVEAFHEFKMYGFIYEYNKGIGNKIEDWVIRNADGRANSMTE